jgi:outer membrane protein OmpA-like peptidoglycan-associated protein/osmotically-inducible protein OsmY
MNWRRWIRPGLAATFLVAVIAVFVRHGAIEHTLADAVTAQLAADGQGWAAPQVSARDVTIRGTAPSVESQQQAVKSAAAVAGVRHVADGSDLLPILAPYVWSAQRDGRAVVLTGAVPSEGVRAAVLAAARRALPEGEIQDAMTLARGAPASFGNGTAFALTRLADLGVGQVTLTDGTLSISGTALNAAAFAKARGELAAALPATVTLGPVAILPARADPFVWSANYDGKSVTMFGFVPNEIVHQTLLATLKATLPGVPVVDSAVIASGDPPRFAEAATFAVGALERLSQGGVTLDGLNLDVAGAAKSVDDYEALLASITAPLPDGMSVVAAAVAPAAVSPYGWQGERTDGKVVLSGYVPSAEERDDVAATARTMFAGLTVDDRVRVAAGEPRMDWIGAIHFAMGQLARLSRGKVAVADKAYSITGDAADADAYGAILDANGKTLPASLELKGADVKAPRVTPYRFVATRQGAGVAMSGYAPDAGDREAIFTEAHRKFGAVEISGDLKFASGAPDGFVGAVSVALQVLSRVAGGHVELDGKALTIDGLVFQPAALEEIADTLDTSLPDGFVVAANTLAVRQDQQPISASLCSDALKAVLKSGGIGFDGNKADISADSIGVLDRVSAAIARCPDTSIEIGAHSDSEGSTARNRDRTQARAEAIEDFLVNAGIKRERLTAVGYGEAKPIADNKTDAGKAANRRIEFTVALPDGG